VKGGGKIVICADGGRAVERTKYWVLRGRAERKGNVMVKTKWEKNSWDHGMLGIRIKGLGGGGSLEKKGIGLGPKVAKERGGVSMKRR